MTTIANSKENNAKVKALKGIERKVGEINWVGSIEHDTLDKCLVVINFESNNGGCYNPVAAQIIGLTGIYMINKDGSIFWEARIIKLDKTLFGIEWLTNRGYNHFENLYSQFINE